MKTSEIRKKSSTSSPPRATSPWPRARWFPATTPRSSSRTRAWSSSRMSSWDREARYNAPWTSSAAWRGRKPTTWRTWATRPSPHVLRDAGQLQLRDYFKRTPSASRGSSSRRSTAAQGEALDHGVRADDEAYDIWTKEIGVPPSAAAHRRQARWPQVRERQLLADGRHRPLWPVLGDLYDTAGHRGAPARRMRRDRYIEIWNLVFMQFNRDDAARAPPPSLLDTGWPGAPDASCSTSTPTTEIDLFQAW